MTHFSLFAQLGNVGMGEILVILLSLAMWIGVPTVLFLFGRRVLRALERRPAGDAQLIELRDQIRALEARVDELGRDTERLEEGHRFTAELLRGRGERLTPPVER